jgi:hypothetical protein
LEAILAAILDLGRKKAAAQQETTVSAGKGFFEKVAWAGERTRDLLISLIFSVNHFTAEPQRLPLFSWLFKVAWDLLILCGVGWGWGPVAPCASPPPWPSIFSNYSFFLSTPLLTVTCGISLHVQWPLTSQWHGSFLKENNCCFCYGSNSTPLSD